MGREREGGAELFGREKERLRMMEEEEKREAPGLEKPQVLRGLLYGEDSSVVVDLPNVGAQHVFLLIELFLKRFPETPILIWLMLQIDCKDQFLKTTLQHLIVYGNE